MKIDKEHFETYTWKVGEKIGQKYYKFEKIAENVGAYVGVFDEVWFELDTLERIGYIGEADVRTSFKTYYCASCTYGWDGKRATKKEQTVSLCTRGDYMTAKNLLLAEYRRRTAK